jgi:transcriptional regulator with XRE-family HTH domain
VQPESKKAVAKRILQLRISRGYTQAFAASLVGVSQPTWAAWESPTDVRMPTRQGLIDFQFKLGVPVEWVLFGDTTRMPSALVQKLVDTAEAVKEGQSGRPAKLPKPASTKKQRAKGTSLDAMLEKAPPDLQKVAVDVVRRLLRRPSRPSTAGDG